MKMCDLSVSALLDLTASDAPAPGGGSISALAGALGAALASMVASLSLGKKGYEDVQEEMTALSAEGKALMDELLAAMDADTEAFNGYMAALALPKSTDEEKAARRAAMQKGLKEAALVPLATARLAARVFPLAEAAVRRGNKNAVTDGMVAALTARSAVLGSLLNVRINLASIRDEAFVAEQKAACAELQVLALAEEAKILALVPELME